MLQSPVAVEEGPTGVQHPPSAPAVARRVFISYSSADRADALELRALLESHGCDVWLDFFDIRPTAQLASELEGGVQSADVVCLMLSPTAVASRWVSVEIEHALERAKEGLRILPVILRPCRIPDGLDGLVGVDAAETLAAEPVRLRLVRAVLGEQAVGDGVLLDATRRTLLANRELQARADEELPAAAAELDRIRDEPIREVTLSVDERSIPRSPPAILELVLELDPLWSGRMSFFLAGYREGATWPPEFGFDEPPYTNYFLEDCKRVDAKFRFYDRLVEPAQQIDGTDLRDLPAAFTLELDGTEFEPATPGIHVRQRLEIPPLRALVDKNARFMLVAHYPETRTAEELDLSATDVDVTLTAYFRGRTPAWCTLFRSRHDPRDRAVLGGGYLSRVESSIEREALLGAYALPGGGEARDEKRRRIASLIEEESDDSLSEEDRRACARMSFGNALVEVRRPESPAPLAGFARASNLLGPLVFDQPPEYDDVALQFRACAHIVCFVAERDDRARALKYLPNLVAVARRGMEADPDEPDYARMLAEAARIAAPIHSESGDRTSASAAVETRIATLRRLAEEAPLRARVKALRDALAESVLLAARYDLEALLPVEEWRAELDPEGERREEIDAVLAKERNTVVPVWFRPVELDGWPTRVAESAMLRYELRLHERWSESPDVQSTNMQVTHVYRGPSPAEWLVVTAMENPKAPASDLSNWIETAMALSGFPVLEMSAALEPAPQLLEWDANGRPADVARAFEVDDARFYIGLARLPGTIDRLARLYALLARRGTFAWKIVLAFESACLPGMPERLVESNDHVRAGAMFGALRLR